MTTIEVTAEDIAQAGTDHYYAVEAALARHCSYVCLISSSVLFIRAGWIPLPKAATEFIVAVLQRRPVQPFSFEMELPIP